MQIKTGYFIMNLSPKQLTDYKEITSEGQRLTKNELSEIFPYNDRYFYKNGELTVSCSLQYAKGKFTKPFEISGEENLDVFETLITYNRRSKVVIDNNSAIAIQDIDKNNLSIDKVYEYGYKEANNLIDHVVLIEEYNELQNKYDLALEQLGEQNSKVYIKENIQKKDKEMNSNKNIEMKKLIEEFNKGKVLLDFDNDVVDEEVVSEVIRENQLLIFDNEKYNSLYALSVIDKEIIVKMVSDNHFDYIVKKFPQYKYIKELENKLNESLNKDKEDFSIFEYCKITNNFKGDSDNLEVKYNAENNLFEIKDKQFNKVLNRLPFNELQKKENNNENIQLKSNGMKM